MHKSHIILLDNNFFLVLNRNQELAFSSRLMKSKPVFSLTSEHCDDFLIAIRRWFKWLRIH